MEQKELRCYRCGLTLHHLNKWPFTIETKYGEIHLCNKDKDYAKQIASMDIYPDCETVEVKI